MYDLGIFRHLFSIFPDTYYVMFSISLAQLIFIRLKYDNRQIFNERLVYFNSPFSCHKNGRGEEFRYFSLIDKLLIGCLLFEIHVSLSVLSPIQLIKRRIYRESFNNEHF